MRVHVVVCVVQGSVSDVDVYTDPAQADARRDVLEAHYTGDAYSYDEDEVDVATFAEEVDDVDVQAIPEGA